MELPRKSQTQRGILMKIKLLPENDPTEVRYRNALSMYQASESEIVKKQTEHEGLLERLRTRAMNPGAIKSLEDFETNDDLALAAASLESKVNRLREQLEIRRTELGNCRGARNVAFSDLNRPLLLEVFKRRARVLVEAARENQNEIDIVSALERLDVQSTIRYMRFGGVGLLDDTQSPIQFHLRELREYFSEIDVDALVKGAK
jgi:hypothetical protein